MRMRGALILLALLLSVGLAQEPGSPVPPGSAGLDQGDSLHGGVRLPPNPRLRFVPFDVTMGPVTPVWFAESSSQAVLLDSVYRAFEYYRRKLEWATIPGRHGSMPTGDPLAGPHRWARIAVPDEIAPDLPRVKLYLIDRGSQPLFVARKDAVVYHLPQDINNLLEYCGMRFVRASVGRWSRVLTFVLAGIREFGLVSPPPSESLRLRQAAILRGEAPYIPAFRMDSIAADTLTATDSGPNASADTGVVAEVRIRYRVRQDEEEFAVRTYHAFILEGEPRQMWPWQLGGDVSVFGPLRVPPLEPVPRLH